jgi:hypothetical protein
MKINTTQILIAAKTYQQNREKEDWSKAKDQKRVYESMLDEGLLKPYSVGGTFIAETKDDKIAVLDIGRKAIEIGVYDDFAGYVNSKRA